MMHWAQVVGYDSAGRVLNYSGVAALTPAEIAAASHKARRSCGCTCTVGTVFRCHDRWTLNIEAKAVFTPCY